MAKLSSGESRKGIQSVGIGLRVLTALASQGGAASLTAIAQSTGLSSSQAHRYLSSLVESGMAKQEQRSGLYDLDSGAIRLGLAALARIDTFRMADDVFGSFARETGRTCLVAAWGDAGATIVRWFDGRPPVVTSLAIGSVLPLLRSATGRVFYSFANAEQIARLGEAALSQEHRLVPSADAIREQVRAEMVSVIHGDLIPGLRAIAAPVFDLQGRLVLVASAVANDVGTDDDERETIILLQDACRQLTEGLGGAWPAPERSPAKSKTGRQRRRSTSGP